MTAETKPSAGCDESAAHSDDPIDGDREVWPVCAGVSFNLWEPDTGDYYDSVDAEQITEHLQDKRLAQRRDNRSAFSQLPEAETDDPATLPCRRPRIAFRDVTRANDTRTFRCALIPADRVLTHKAPYLLQTRGSAADEAYVLGVLSSMIFDWQARRTAELNMTFETLNQASVPDPGEGHRARDRVAQIAGQLAAADNERFSDWAQQAGIEPTTLDPAGREKLLAELDACVAVLYGLNAEDLAVLYDTFARAGQWDTHHDAVIHAMESMSAGSGADP